MPTKWNFIIVKSHSHITNKKKTSAKQKILQIDSLIEITIRLIYIILTIACTVTILVTQ